MTAPRPRLWDNTALDCLARCEEEFVRRYVLHLATPVPDASALFGQAIHAGVAALFDGVPTEEAAQQAALVWGGVGRSALTTPLGLDVARLAEGERQAARGETRPLSDVVEDLRERAERAAEMQRRVEEQKPHLTADYAAAIVRMYAAEYPLAARGNVLMNERYLEWPEARICGVVDRVVRRPVGDGMAVVRDLKTTGLSLNGRSGERWARQWAHNLQTGSFYLDLAEHELGTGHHAETPQSPPSGASLSPCLPVETVWIDAIHVDRRGYPKPDDFHMFGPFHYSPALRDELRSVRESLIERADSLVEHPEWADKNPRSCFRYNQVCSFFEFCVCDPEDREARYAMALASGELVERVWKPKERA